VECRPPVGARPPVRPAARPTAGSGLQCYRRWRTTDANRRQRAKQYWPIRRASNNERAIATRLGSYTGAARSQWPAAAAAAGSWCPRSLPAGRRQHRWTGVTSCQFHLSHTSRRVLELVDARPWRSSAGTMPRPASADTTHHFNATLLLHPRPQVGLSVGKTTHQAMAEFSRTYDKHVWTTNNRSELWSDLEIQIWTNKLKIYAGTLMSDLHCVPTEVTPKIHFEYNISRCGYQSLCAVCGSNLADLNPLSLVPPCVADVTVDCALCRQSI